MNFICQRAAQIHNMTLPNRIRPAFACMAGIALLLLTACNSDASHRINVSGSTSVSPFAEHLAELYQKQHAGESINVQSLGSSAGIQAAMEGVAEIGMSSRELKPEEAERLDELVIARDGLAVIVHPSNPISSLTQQQVQDIFSGKINNWKEIGGIDHSITLVAREAGSGTYSAFDELMLKGQHVTSAALRQGSNGAIRQVVAEDPNAVGYISIGIVDNSVKAVIIDDVQPSIDNVRNNLYKFARNFLFVWPKGKQLDPLAQDYVNYVMSDEGQAEMERLGLVGVK
jgi:phosphate transport system substrate-binding protein